jgi:lipoprotein-anchoring transpeptidase ErfK/SrfK
VAAARGRACASFLCRARGAALLTCGALTLLVACGDGEPPATRTSTTVAPTSSVAAPSSTTLAPTTSTVPATRALSEGAEGDDVRAMQQRLLALGYWLNDPPGLFRSATRHAVVAFEKLHGLARDGVVTGAASHALSVASRPTPRTTAGRAIEIDRTRQVLLVVADGRVEWVFDTSTGRRGWATPLGHFAVYREIDGYRTSPLGVLYRPKYVVRGVAVHGYPSVPAYPASHGCIRVTNAAMDFLWATDAMRISTPVLIY